MTPLARVCNAGALRINKIQWTVSGKVKAVTRTTGSTLQPLEFAYGASGQRISKQVGGTVMRYLWASCRSTSSATSRTT